jgi:hypothetical protein
MPSKRDLIKALNSVPRGTFALVPWRTYVVHNSDSSAKDNVLLRIPYRRVSEPTQFWKVIFDRTFFDDNSNSLAQGNHSVINPDHEIQHVELPQVKLAHFPVRSREQIILKSVCGWFANLIWDKDIVKKGNSFQWRQIYDMIVNGEENNIDIEKISRDYADYSRITDGANYIGYSEGLIKDPIKVAYELCYTNDNINALMSICRMFEKYIISPDNEGIKEVT